LVCLYAIHPSFKPVGSECTRLVYFTLPRCIRADVLASEP
jgi:hypothetical protein